LPDGFARRVKLGEIAAARASLKRDEAPVGVFGVTPRQRRKTNFASPFKSIERFKSQVQKYSSSVFRKCMVLFAHPVPTRGALRDRHECRARDAMDVSASTDE